AMARHFSRRLGIASPSQEDARALIGAAEQHMRAAEIGPDAFFFTHRGGRNAPDGPLGEALEKAAPLPGALDHALWSQPAPPSMIIDEVERIWSAIDDKDDWQALADTLSTLRLLGIALREVEDLATVSA
ncbi:MAG: selenoprotein O, partial [Novosphingobium sp.]